ncbi:MAG: hypothetical protein JO256_07395 [Alphaproteobacteria bacterium]|nr:hypothetical protein [Alphaproteobacteria bacterium]
MDIHKPKPFHDWREFLKEYAIIVLGVATALAAEQAVVILHDRAKAAEARANIRAEIIGNLRAMELREGTEDCQARRMEEIDGLIAASAAGKLLAEPLWLGQPYSFILPDSRYKAALQSGAVSLFDDMEQAAYSNIYAFFAQRDLQVEDEIRAWADLRTLEDHPPPSATLDWQLRSAMKRARVARWAIDALHASVVQSAAQIGIRPADPGKPDKHSICVKLHTPRAEALKQLGTSLGRHLERQP